MQRPDTGALVPGTILVDDPQRSLKKKLVDNSLRSNECCRITANEQPPSPRESERGTPFVEAIRQRALQTKLKELLCSVDGADCRGVESSACFVLGSPGSFRLFGIPKCLRWGPSRSRISRAARPRATIKESPFCIRKNRRIRWAPLVCSAPPRARPSQSLDEAQGPVLRLYAAVRSAGDDAMLQLSF